ncbi:hypothetical protein [uncultured Bilophila sp.]|uniref:hypothetical protein n=1 Tax=uncultured Bilophila sp. TaxID=529385 RepID=UPI0026DD5544|nr:hypothetical protein [uncultured Bilophila sp.]
MTEAIILIIVLGVTVGILWLAKRHGIVMRVDADGLEALPKELHEAEMREKEKKGYLQ